MIETEFAQVDPDTFRILLATAQTEQPLIREATSTFHDEPGTRYFANGSAGYAVRLDGELVYVHATRSGHGPAIMADALANGAVYLDCFDGYLPTFYARHGFQIDATVPNWTPGEPDVVYMSLPGYSNRNGIEGISA